MFEPVPAPTSRPAKRRKHVVTGSGGGGGGSGPLATETVTFKVVEAFERANGRFIVQVSHLHGSDAFGCDLLSLASEAMRDKVLAERTVPDPDRITWGGKSYFKKEGWPPPKAVKGQVAVLVGFPGIHREPSRRGLEVRATPVCDFVTSVSDRNIFLVDEDLARVAVKHNPELKDLGSLGGMSGSAVYVVDENRHVPVLAGFLYEAGEGTHATIFIAHASYILPDGHLDRASMPW